MYICGYMAICKYIYIYIYIFSYMYIHIYANLPENYMYYICIL